jgi:soluble lytic murein transglycosylase-like protein
MTRTELEELANESARDQGIPPAGLRALLRRESGWDPSAVNQSSGALGIAQFMPRTAAELEIDPMDPAQAIPAASAYLIVIRSYLIGRIGRWSWPMVVAAYNWGMGNVARTVEERGDAWLAFAPIETQKYVAAVAPAFGGGGLWVLVGLLAILVVGWQ